MSYYEKYIKYKSKYNLVKKQIGGANTSTKNEMVTYTYCTDIPNIKEITKKDYITIIETSRGLSFTESDSVVGYSLRNYLDVYDGALMKYRTYIISYHLKYPEGLSETAKTSYIMQSSTKGGPISTINLQLKEALLTKTIIDDISINIGFIDIYYRNKEPNRKLDKKKLFSVNNAKFVKNGELSNFKSFCEYIKELGKPEKLPTEVTRAQIFGRTIYPDFHAKLNNITITYDVIPNSIVVLENFDIQKITINFP
jgi:hypothetical protein